MLVLDTNHYTELERNAVPGQRLTARLKATVEERAVGIATVEEVLRGWLADIKRWPDLDRQILPYAKLQRQVESLGNWTILAWDAEAAALFRRMREQGIRIGTMDLKIASICMAHDALLLTRNARDFIQVPGLRFENWLD